MRGLSLLRSAVLVGAIGYVAFHAWEMWPASYDSDLFFARFSSRLDHPIARWVDLVGSFFVMLSAIASSAFSFRALRAEDAPDDPGLLRLQIASGIGSIGLAALHLSAFVAPLLRGTTPASLIDAFSSSAGRLPAAIAYAAGLVALAFHFALEIPTAFRDAGWVRGPSPARLSRYVAAGLSAAFFLAYFHVYSRFATGAAIFATHNDDPDPSPSSQAAP